MPKVLLKERDIIKRIAECGGVMVRHKGSSHIRFVCPCGEHFTTVPSHGELKEGTAKGIQRDLAPCAAFGKGWLER